MGTSDWHETHSEHVTMQILRLESELTRIQGRKARAIQTLISIPPEEDTSPLDKLTDILGEIRDMRAAERE